MTKLLSTLEYLISGFAGVVARVNNPTRLSVTLRKAHLQVPQIHGIWGGRGWVESTQHPVCAGAGVEGAGVG